MPYHGWALTQRMSTDSLVCNAVCDGVGIAKRRQVAACAFAILLFSPWATAAQRLYVEPFNTKSGGEKLREQVIAELRKSGAVSLAPSESSADLILGGGGEIWIKGYRSLNPRSGISPANGTP